MNSRRRALAVLVASLALLPKTALAQRSRPARLGWLSYLSDPDPALAMLRDGLRELGYVEGTSHTIITRFAKGDFKRLPALVEELVAERVDVLVSRGPTT